MSLETFGRVAEQILAYPGFEAVYFSGMGEPSLHPALPTFIAALSPALPTCLTTNVAALSPAKIQALVDAGLGHAIVSFTGHTQPLYGLMTGGLSLADADERVRDLLRLGQGQLQVSANVSVTLHNQAHLAEIRDHLLGLGVHEVTYALCHNRGGCLDDPSVCRTPLPPLGQGRCDIFAHTLYVAWDGQVLSCCHDLSGQGRLASLVDEDLATIMERKRRIVETGVRFPMCPQCNDMYRYAQDPTPDGRPLSEWIYLLFSDQGQRESNLIEVIREQEDRVRGLEARVHELDALLAGYQRGRFIRFTRWLYQLRRRLRGHRP